MKHLKILILSLCIFLPRINANELNNMQDSLETKKLNNYNIGNNSPDSVLILLEQEKKLILELRDQFTSKIESPSNPIIGYILAFIGVLITAGVSYKVGINQGKSNLKIKRIDILTYDKSKLTDLKKEIVGHKLDLPNHKIITLEQMGSSAIDSIVFRILEVLKLSEYFDINFIQQITEYNDSLQRFMGSAKLGQKIDENEARQVLERMKDIEKLITENVNSEIKKRQINIEELL